MIKKKHNNFPFHPSKTRIFYGWYILVLATFGIIMSAPGQTLGVSTFTDHLLSALSLTRDQLSLAYMLGTIGSSLVITFVGKLYDRIGARWLGVFITCLLGVVLMMLSQVDRIALLIGGMFQLGSNQLYLSFGMILFCFFLLRFSGQGALTMLSRNMLMKWFISRRGLASGLSSVFVSFGFSLSPLFFNFLIEGFSWRIAWIILSLICGFGFSIIVFLFFRDNPEDCDLKPDNGYVVKTNPKVKVKAEKQFTLKEARKTFSFWIFILSLAMFSLYYTGFAFHLISIFEHTGLGKEKALAVFIPTSIVSVFVSLSAGWLSDRIHLKKLLITFLIGGVCSMSSLALLKNDISYLFLIIGNSLMNGLFSVLTAVVWPRFFGREHLGAISGFAVSILVFFSAIGPLLFSYSLTLTGGYAVSSWICAGITFTYLILAFKANNPQDSTT